MKNTKKLISVLLCVLMIFSSVSVIAFAENTTKYATKLPTVYVSGQGRRLYQTNEDGSTTEIYPFTIEDGYIGDCGKALLKPLAKGLAKDDWDEYCDVLCDSVDGVVGQLGLDENGNAYEGQHCGSNRPYANCKDSNGNYYLTASGVSSYHFDYDWRLDLFETAQKLHEYIEAAKENGTDKYISIDKQIDASTCYLPDHTWFIKNCAHLSTPDVINELLVAICDSENYMTVFDNESFPQYMFYQKTTNTFEPLNEENCQTNKTWSNSKLDTLITFFLRLIEVLVYYIGVLLGKV